MKYALTIFTVMSLLSPAVLAIGFGDLSKAASFAKSAKQVSTPVTGEDRCAPVPEAPQSLAPMERAKAMATKKAIELAVNRLTSVLGGTEPVGKITSYCDVDKKLAALETQSLRLGNYVNASAQKSLAALANEGAVGDSASFDDTSGSMGDISKQIKKNTKKIVKKAAKVKQADSVNQALLNESVADLTAALRPAALLLAHDLAVVDFVQTYPRWAVENVGQAKQLASQMNLLVAAGSAVQQIREASLANENLAVDVAALDEQSAAKQEALAEQTLAALTEESEAAAE